jgi:hypothetical protein
MLFLSLIYTSYFKLIIFGSLYFSVACFRVDMYGLRAFLIHKNRETYINER